MEEFNVMTFPEGYEIVKNVFLAEIPPENREGMMLGLVSFMAMY